jgi:peptidoglycan hydrolase-like protein with peptidoglycan-binding domain
VAAALTIPAAATAAPAHPVPTVKLPATPETLAPYVAQDSCDATPKPGVSAFRKLMLATYHEGSDGGISRGCTDGGTSEHKEGRAWDWMLSMDKPAERATAQALLAWLLAPGPGGAPAWNARRFGIMYIIWDRKIWGSYYADKGWRPYSGASEHTDHIHFSFSWAGAMARTSWWTGKVAPTDYGPCVTVAGQLATPYRAPNLTPCPAPATAAPKPSRPAAVAFARPGDSSAHVVALQRRLGISPATGFFGSRTLAAVQAYQRAHHLVADGVVSTALAGALGLVPVPKPAPKPAPKPKPAPHHITVLARPGDSGALVVALQRALRVSPQSGSFGPKTQAALAHYQHAHHLPPSGILDIITARTLHLAR